MTRVDFNLFEEYNAVSLLVFNYRIEGQTQARLM